MRHWDKCQEFVHKCFKHLPHIVGQSDQMRDIWHTKPNTNNFVWRIIFYLNLCDEIVWCQSMKDKNKVMFTILFLWMVCHLFSNITASTRGSHGIGVGIWGIQYVRSRLLSPSFLLEKVALKDFTCTWGLKCFEKKYFEKLAGYGKGCQ